LERIFNEKIIDISIEENQGEQWLGAKTTFYEDK
jgi:hypothetical protein